MSILIERGETSIIRAIFIGDDSSASGAGKTGIVYNSSGIACHYWYPGVSGETAITLEDISTLGTYSAPTSNAHMRIKQIDATNFPGYYEIQIHDDWASIVNARKQAVFLLRGASGMVTTPVRFELTPPTGVKQIVVSDADFSPTTTAFEVTGITDATTNAYKDTWVKFLTGNNTGEAKKVTASGVTTTLVRLTVDTMQAAPATGNIAIIF